jgi:hypothetical protein
MGKSKYLSSAISKYIIYVVTNIEGELPRLRSLKKEFSV